LFNSFLGRRISENYDIFSLNCGTGGVSQRAPFAHPRAAVASCAARFLNYEPCLTTVTANGEKLICSFMNDYCFVQLITDQTKIIACDSYKGA